MPASRGLPTWQLFAIAVAIWGTTWHAILYQLASTTPEVGVTLRFALAGMLALALAAWRGDRVRCHGREHARVYVRRARTHQRAHRWIERMEFHADPCRVVSFQYAGAVSIKVRRRSEK